MVHSSMLTLRSSNLPDPAQTHFGVTPVYGDPTRKTSMAMAEIRVQIHALGMKRIMLANSLLIEHWPLASKQHAWLYKLSVYMPYSSVI